MMNDTLPSFFSKDDNIFGLSYKDWITKWCQWFYGKNDATKELECESIDNVYFLAQNLHYLIITLYLMHLIKYQVTRQY